MEKKASVGKVGEVTPRDMFDSVGPPSVKEEVQKEPKVRILGKLRCRDCGEIYDDALDGVNCPRCGSNDATAVKK